MLRFTLILALTISSGIAAYAAENNPLFGTWRLNASKSVVDGGLPAFIHDGVLKMRRPPNPAPYNKDLPIRLLTSVAGEKTMFNATVSADGKTLTLNQAEDAAPTRALKPRHSVLVLERE